jgi:hypothetical protein
VIGKHHNLAALTFLVKESTGILRLLAAWASNYFWAIWTMENTSRSRTSTQRLTNNLIYIYIYIYISKLTYDYVSFCSEAFCSTDMPHLLPNIPDLQLSCWSEDHTLHSSCPIKQRRHGHLFLSFSFPLFSYISVSFLLCSFLNSDGSFWTSKKKRLMKLSRLIASVAWPDARVAMSARKTIREYHMIRRARINPFTFRRNQKWNDKVLWSSLLSRTS